MNYADTAELPFEPFPKSALDGSIVDRFNAVVRRFPTRLAVSDATQSLTYSELASLVDRIAVAVAAAINERTGPVAIFRANDVHYVAAVLGTLAAGRGYVPMDADYPTERNRLIATHAGVAAVITAGDFVDQVRDLVPCSVPILDTAILRTAPDLISLRKPGPTDLAHILYTSGSTGVPKGVYQNHRGQLQAILQRTNTLHLSHDDRLALFHSPSTVDGARVTLAALLNGASLHILPPTDWNLPALAKEICAREITVCHAVPTLFRHLVRALPEGERFDKVRIVHLSGERVDWNDLHLVERCCRSDALLVAALGSTEFSASYIQWFVDEKVEQTSSQLPIGRDVADFRLTIIDHEGRPVRDGEVGEIVVSSPYMALGYWRDPELTARVFAVDVADPGLRILKTGDLGRRRPDGLLDFLGRKDHQIKLRGHRIELGEIESTIRECEGVGDAAILVRNTKECEPRSLAAYVEVRSGSQGGETTVRLASFLAQRLPGYMVPSTIVLVDALPRLPNLKIDREELRRRDQSQHEHTSPGVESSNKIQEALLELWRRVLDRHDIGCDDDFFLCGGNSLSAVDLFHRIEDELQYQLPLTILTEAPTVRQLEARLETRTLGPVNNMIRVHTAGRHRPLFAVYGIGGHALGLLPVLRSLGPDQPCYALQPPGMDWTSAGCTTLPQIAAHYIGELKAVQPQGPYRLLGVSFGGLVVFEMALQLQRIGEVVELLAIVDTNPPTCLFESKADVRQPHLVPGAQPRRPDTIEAVNLRVIETYLQMTRNYVLDSQSDQNVFRSELTYFHCTGNPVVAGNDRRPLWQHFASRIRLLQLPGPHGPVDRGPQYAALQGLLRDSLNGEPPVGCDPASVYDCNYRIDKRDQRESILSSAGDMYRVEQDRTQGHVDEVRMDAERIQIVGWAVEPCHRQPAQTIAVFLEGRFLGYGSSGELRPDVAKHLAATSAQYAGFNFQFRRSAADSVIGRPRLFVLSSDGCAAELRDSIEPVVIGSVEKLSNTEPLRVILSGNWSTREAWGVWSDGHRAAVTFDASSLPDHFTVAIEAHFLQLNPASVQKVRISNDSGYLLTTISNEQPNGNFVVDIEQKHFQPPKWTSLIFDVDKLISPLDLGISGDSRRLGIGLVSLTFQECTTLTSVDS